MSDIECVVLQNAHFAWLILAIFCKIFTKSCILTWNLGDLKRTSERINRHEVILQLSSESKDHFGCLSTFFHGELDGSELLILAVSLHDGMDRLAEGVSSSLGALCSVIHGSRELVKSEI